MSKIQSSSLHTKLLSDFGEADPVKYYWELRGQETVSGILDAQHLSGSLWWEKKTKKPH